MYKLLLCHRRREKVSSGQLHQQWKCQRGPMILDLQDQLGFVRYAQVYQLPRRNFFYRVIRFTRSWIVTTFFAAKQGQPVRPKSTDQHTPQEERWDVVEQFWFADKQALITALSREQGQQACQKLADDQTDWVRRTAVCLAEEFVVNPDPTNRSPRLTTLFFLRTYAEKTREEMLDYWGTSHKELVASLQSSLGYRAYDQLHVRTDAPLAAVIENLGGSAGEEFAGVASLSYTNQWELVLGFLNPLTQIANIKLIKDEVGFIDAQRSPLVFGKQLFF